MLDPIPPPLRDRMEVFEIQGYGEEEKIQIAQRYLVSSQTEEHGITPEQIEFPEKLSAMDPALYARSRRAELERNRNRMPQASAPERRRQDREALADRR